MNYSIIKGKINGKWWNGLTGEKRSLNLLVVEGSTTYKTSFWQDEADCADIDLNEGDELTLTGQISGFWKKEDEIAGIEISKPEIVAINRLEHLKADLVAKIFGRSEEKRSE